MKQVLSVLTILLLMAPGRVHAASSMVKGVTDTEIIIGQCAALAGPAAGLGTGMSIGMKAAFDEINGKGGIRGRKIRLISVDDGYEPEKCVDCTEKMIEEQGVFALAGFVGTPTAKVAVPIVQELKVPLIGLFTGASLLRQPVARYVINIRAGYDDETEALVQHLIAAGAAKIAVFYQNDSFGLAGLAGVEKALTKRQLKLAAKGYFERNTLAVKSGLADLLPAAPDVVIIVSPYKPTAEFIRSAKEAGLKARYATISFVGTENLISELGPASAGMLISQVVPTPDSDDYEIAKQYRAALKASSPSVAPSFVSFEGYISARVLLAAIDKAGQELTRENLVDSFDSMSKLDLGGLSMSFSSSNHQGSNSVFLTIVKDGRAQPVK